MTTVALDGMRNRPVRAKMFEPMADGCNRNEIRAGMEVSIVLKQDQRSGTLTRGVVRDILTNSANHPHGIKVRLEGGQVGRVKVIEGQR